FGGHGGKLRVKFDVGDGVAINEAPPGHHAGVGRRLSVETHIARDGLQPVTRDHQLMALAAITAKREVNAVGVLAKVNQFTIGLDGDALRARRLKKKIVQIRAMQMPGGRAVLALAFLSVFKFVVQPLRRGKVQNTDVFHRVFQLVELFLKTQLNKDATGFNAHGDARTHFPKLSGLLINDRREPVALQGQRRSEPANTGADNGKVRPRFRHSLMLP
ncbi:MAG: hypothetical protein AAFU65_10325, partial [Pseudomonadota bacterium]